ncbi:leucine-rich repeat-containing protein 15-like isoform X2 [Coccinella septempunctata]|uniref:leucine-rich repeat-containing protein 15-like isoform X2 n=1 Tax=Coccinella septempunctata TaxID=41139 RepID=UPI001D066553|nr:leucine-rich repeat-containing protein 15-like isoform X2 [Coccinella septempunctata]
MFVVPGFQRLKAGGNSLLWLKYASSIASLSLWMLISWQHAYTWLILLWICTTTRASCPSHCTCDKDQRGKHKTSCLKGGMIQLPTRELDPAVEILEIDAPAEIPNSLTISPVFQHLKHLEELIVRRSQLKQLGMHSFWGVPTIRVLDFTFNNLTSVLDHNFRGLLNLVELNLDHNRISNLQSGVFKHLTELRILSLRFNLLVELVPRMFMKLGKLHVLKLSGNPFEELDPEAFKDIPEVRTLECRSCGLPRINTQIYHLLPYLNHLDLGNNRMQFLEADEFTDLHKLHSLKLDGNQFPVILENTFVHQTQMKYLNVARNRLAKITNTSFRNLTSLQELDISYNKLDKLEPLAMQHVAGTLEKFSMSGNNFNLLVIRDVLQTLYKVNELHIAKMGIRELPEHFLPHTIRKLNISCNNFTELTIEMLPKQINELDISHNKLKGLSDRVIAKLDTLKSVNLSSNPWSCDLCHITPILLRVNRTNLFKNSICDSPKYLKGSTLTILQLADLTSCKNSESGNENKQSVLGTNISTLLVGVMCFLVLLSFSVIYVVYSCMRRRTLNMREIEKREREREIASLSDPVAVFSKDNITFKFPLDLTDNKVSVCTIDDIKRHSQTSCIPNGTVI